jgi:hypothetical protein
VHAPGGVSGDTAVDDMAAAATAIAADRLGLDVFAKISLKFCQVLRTKKTSILLNQNRLISQTYLPFI